MAPGSESYHVNTVLPPASELTPAQPNDGQQRLIGGSATVGFAIPPQPTFTQVVGEDKGLGDNVKGERITGQPLVGGSAAVLGVIPAAMGSAQVIKSDPDLLQVPPGLALPYGNNDLGVTGTIVLAPQSAGPQGSAAINDPDAQREHKEPLGQGNQSDIKSTVFSSPQTGTLASGGVLLPDQVQDKNPSQIPATQPVNQPGVTDQNPTAPQTGGIASGGVVNAQRGEAGYIGPGSLVPPVQYK